MGGGRRPGEQLAAYLALGGQLLLVAVRGVSRDLAGPQGQSHHQVGATHHQQGEEVDQDGHAHIVPAARHRLTQHDAHTSRWTGLYTHRCFAASSQEESKRLKSPSWRTSASAVGATQPTHHQNVF